MIILGEEAQVEGRFDLFGDRANLDARLVHPMELLDDVCHMNLTSVDLEIVLVSMQDRCMVCA